VIFFSLIFSIAWTVFILFLWFKTDFLLFYAEVCGLSSRLRIPRFRELQQEGVVDNFIFFLWMEFKNDPWLKFPAKLFSCIYCFTFWLTLVVCFFYSWSLIPLNYLLSLLIFNSINKNDTTTGIDK